MCHPNGARTHDKRGLLPPDFAPALGADAAGEGFDEAGNTELEFIREFQYSSPTDVERGHPEEFGEPAWVDIACPVFVAHRLTTVLAMVANSTRHVVVREYSVPLPDPDDPLTHFRNDPDRLMSEHRHGRGVVTKHLFDISPAQAAGLHFDKQVPGAKGRNSDVDDLGAYRPAVGSASHDDGFHLLMRTSAFRPSI